MSEERHLWIVDDDPVFRMIFCMTITKIDAEITLRECPDGIDFLDNLQEILHNGAPLPNIVFLDLNMPDKSGWEVLDALRSFEHLKPDDIKIYVLSSSINPEDERNAKDFVFCNGFLVKPISKKTLNKVLALT